MSWRPLPGCCSFAVIVLVAACADPGIAITDAYVREPVPGTDKTVGYFNLSNRTDEQVVFVGARSDAVRAIEIHTTRADDDGMMRMRRLGEVPVEPGHAVSFEPGGMHLMLFGVGEPGDSLQVSLLFEGGESHLVEFDVVGLLD